MFRSVLLHLFASYDSEGHLERSCLVGEIKRLKTLKKVVFSPALSVWCTRHPANTVFLYRTSKCKLYKLWECARSLSEFTALYSVSKVMTPWQFILLKLYLVFNLFWAHFYFFTMNLVVLCTDSEMHSHVHCIHLLWHWAKAWLPFSSKPDVQESHHRKTRGKGSGCGHVTGRVNPNLGSKGYEDYF